MKIFDAFCKINMRGAFQVEELALMIRATRGRSHLSSKVCLGRVLARFWVDFERIFGEF